jgi:hypothetical protein
MSHNPVTHIGVAQDAIEDILNEDATDIGSPLAGLIIEQDDPLPFLMNQVWGDVKGRVWVDGTVNNVTQDYASSGADDAPEDEHFDLHVHVIIKQAAKFKETRDVALGIAEQIQRLVRADRSLGGVLFPDTQCVVDSLTQAVLQTGTYVEIVLRLTCFAELVSDDS